MVVSTVEPPVPTKPVPVEGAVHVYQTLRVAATPPWAGSPVSRVALTVVPVRVPLAPLAVTGAPKPSFAGGVSAPQRRVTPPRALASSATRYVVPAVTGTSTRLVVPPGQLSLPATGVSAVTSLPV